MLAAVLNGSLVAQSVCFEGASGVVYRASFPRLTAPRSCGGATKSVRFMDPVVGEIFEKPKAEKRGRVKSAAKGVWKNLKKKLICGAKLDFGAPMAVQSPVTKGCRKRGHQYKA